MPKNMAELVTIPNVEICETGVDWPASTGPVTFTAADLLSAAEAPANDPAVKLPRMRFGHTTPGTPITESMGGFKEQPCVGKFTNLRVEQDGNLLVGDLVGVPRWLAEILPVAYPSRSVEAFFEVSTNTGRKHKMIVTSVALLGENLPGVQTLDDLEYLFSDEPTEWIEALTAKTKVAASQIRPGGDPIPAKRVAASVDTSDVRSAFYEQVATEESGRYWWWLHQMYLDPAVAIAEDENMEYWLVPYSTSSSGVEFGDPVQVFIQWVEKESGAVAASAAANVRIPKEFGEPSNTWMAAADSRPADRQKAWAEKTTKEAKAAMAIDIPALRSATGISSTDLPDDATEEQINEALAAHSEANGGDDEEPAGTDEAPEGEDDENPSGDEGAEGGSTAASNVIQIDRGVLRQLQDGAKAGTELRQERDRNDNAAFLDGALRQGKISPATRASYLAQMNGPKNDGRGPARAEIRKLIEGLPEGVVPVDEIGHSEGESTSAAQGTGLFPELDRQRASAQEA